MLISGPKCQFLCTGILFHKKFSSSAVNERMVLGQIPSASVKCLPIMLMLHLSNTLSHDKGCISYFFHNNLMKKSVPYFIKRGYHRPLSVYESVLNTNTFYFKNFTEAIRHRI